MTKNRRRNQALIEKQKNTLVVSFENGATMTDSCEKAGISRACFYLWLKADAKFNQRIQDAEMKKVESVEGAMFKRAVGYEVEETHIVKGFPLKSTKHIPGDVTAQIFITCNLLSDKYKNIQRVDTTSKVTSEVEISDEDRVLLKGFADSLTRLKAGIK